MRVRINRGSVTASCVVVVTACALLTAPTADAAAPASPWLHAEGNAASSNANLAETTLSPSTIGRASAVTTLSPTGTSCSQSPASFSAPLISESRMYVTSGTKLLAYTLAGAPLWQRALPQDLALRPAAVSHGLVVVGGNDCTSVSDAVGSVRAYYADTGKPAWTLRLPYHDVLQSVVVSGKYVVARTGYVNGDVELTVYRVQDGQRVWTLPGTYGGSGLQKTSGLVIDGKIFTREDLDSQFPTTRARDLATGAVVQDDLPFREIVERGDLDTPGVRHIYTHLDPDIYGSDDGLYDVDPDTGDNRFTLAGGNRSLAVDGSRVYATCASDATIVCAYNKNTGTRLWVRGVPSSVQSAITADGVLYLVSGLVLDAATGRALRSLPGRPVAIGQGRVAVLRTDGSLQLFGLAG